jgi:quercetin dioxygenase-like cupin family protein
VIDISCIAFASINHLDRMAYKNKQISNPKTGQSIRFIQTARDTKGELLEMETSFAPGSKEPLAHYHPNQAEHFTVLQGQLNVKMNGTTKVYAEGDEFDVPKNTVHAMWNNADSVAVVNWKVTPALNTENFFEISMGLAMEGKTNEAGMPPFLQLAMIASKYDSIFRLAKPPYLIQKLLFAVLSPIGYLKGYRSSYKKYVD